MFTYELCAYFTGAEECMFTVYNYASSIKTLRVVRGLEARDGS